MTRIFRLLSCLAALICARWGETAPASFVLLAAPEDRGPALVLGIVFGLAAMGCAALFACWAFLGEDL